MNLALSGVIYNMATNPLIFLRNIPFDGDDISIAARKFENGVALTLEQSQTSMFLSNENLKLLLDFFLDDETWEKLLREAND